MKRSHLAKAITGMTDTKISLVFSCRRRLSACETDEIRRFFGYFLPEDQPEDLRAKVVREIAGLDENQLRAVSMYLDALAGRASEEK